MPSNSESDIYLKDATVNTLHILDGSITSSVSSTHDGLIEYKQYDVEYELSRVAVEKVGGRVLLQYCNMGLTSSWDSGANPSLTFRVRRNGVVIKTVRFDRNNKFYWGEFTDSENINSPIQQGFKIPNLSLPMITDNPPQGTHVYTVSFERRGMDASNGTGTSRKVTRIWDGSLTAFISKR